jgi:ubiquinone biosynthesis protein COQ4
LPGGALFAARCWASGLAMFSRLLVDPDDTRAATDGTVYLNAPVFPKLLRRLRQDAGGRKLLGARPRLDSQGVDFAALSKLPPGTLGREYADFYRGRGLSPDDFQELPGVVSGDEAYVALRLRQSHDIWHIVTGIGTDVSGEIELQAFTFGQLGTPSSFLLGFGGALRWAHATPGLISRVRRAHARGRRAAFLAAVFWEEHFETAVAALKGRLGLL